MEMSSFQRRMEIVQRRMEEARNRMPSDRSFFYNEVSDRVQRKPDERLFVLVMAAGQKPFVVANQLYALQASVIPAGDFVYWSDGENGVEVLCQELERRGVDLSSAACR